LHLQRCAISGSEGLNQPHSLLTVFYLKNRATQPSLRFYKHKRDVLEYREAAQKWHTIHPMLECSKARGSERIALLLGTGASSPALAASCGIVPPSQESPASSASPDHDKTRLD
jgi:hypothetical protein